MNDNHIDIVNSHHVEGWLMDVPGYREDYQHEQLLLTKPSQSIDVESSDDDDNGKERPLSMASIGSEDSVNLDELINANFTTDMDDETELPFLATLDIEDTSEDFWKTDNILDHQLLSEKKISSIEEFHSIYYSSKKAAENDYLDTLNYSPPSSYKNDDFIHGPSSVTIPSKLQVPRSALPVSPKSISSNESIKRDRSGSFSSENSLTSQSTITNSLFQRHPIYPSESTSTSTIGSHSTATSGFLSRSHTLSSLKSENSNIRLPHTTNNSSTTTNNTVTTQKQQQNTRVLKSKASMVPSLSDYGRKSSIFNNDHTSIPSKHQQQQQQPKTGLARRATHIPAPSSTHQLSSKLLNSSINTPVRTKSTCVLPKNKPESRSVSRIGQPQQQNLLLQKRASHIPTPASTRSNSSLGHSSIFGSPSVSNRTQDDYPSRPKTSMATPVRSPSSLTSYGRTTTTTNMRTNSVIGAAAANPSPSKSTHLRASSNSKMTRATSSLGRFSTTTKKN